MPIRIIFCLLLLAFTNSFAINLDANVQAEETTVALSQSKPFKFVIFKNHMKKKSYVEFKVYSLDMTSGKLIDLIKAEKRNIIVTPLKTIFLPERKKKVRIGYVGDFTNEKEKYFIVKPHFHFSPEIIKKEAGKAKISIKKFVLSHTLVTVPPKSPHPNVSVKVENEKAYFNNQGNVYVNIEGISYCVDKLTCHRNKPRMRLYPGQKRNFTLDARQDKFMKYIVVFDDGEKLQKTEHFVVLKR